MWPQEAAIHENPIQVSPVSAKDAREPHNPGVFLEENLFLQRAFSQAMQPSKIIPFYYQASGNFPRSDVTIATIVTSNRFEVLTRLVQRYQGRHAIF